MMAGGLLCVVLMTCVEAADDGGRGELCYSINDGRVAKVMMTAGRLLQYRWRRSDRGVDDCMDGGLMYSEGGLAAVFCCCCAGAYKGID